MNNQDQLVNGVDRMHDIAYALVGGNARAWANKAEQKGIISINQKSEINKIVDMRVFIAHGGAGKVIVSKADIDAVNKYIRIMNNSAPRFKRDNQGLPPGGFRGSFIKELNLDGKKNTYYFKFEVVKEYQERAYDDGTRFKGVGYTIYVLKAPYKQWCLDNNVKYEFHYYRLPKGSESVCWNRLITNFVDANKIMLVWAKRYVQILDRLDMKSINMDNYDKKQKQRFNIPAGTFRAKEILFSSDIYEQIKNTLGKLKPEQGGILGINNYNNVINVFVHDETAKVGRMEYNPNVKFINKILNEKWSMDGTDFCGFIHSHPNQSNILSKADVEYAIRIMQALDLAYLYMPLVNSSADGKFNVYGYIVKKNGVVDKCKVKVVEESANREFDNNDEQSDNTLNEDDIMSIFDSMGTCSIAPRALDQFDRIHTAVPLDYLGECTIVGVGCGGAREFYCDMARMGVRKFILMDGDDVSITNIGTQNVYVDEIGKKKVDVIRNRISQINANCNITAYPFNLDDSLSDVWVETNLLKLDRQKMILCAFTDDFYCQSRLNNIAVKYNIPLLAAQHHRYGETSEVVYWYPDVTPALPQTILKDRYEAYRNGYKNDVTSEASLIFNTVRLNAFCEKIALGLLMYGFNNYNNYSSFLICKPEYNLIFIRQNSLLASESSLKNVFIENENMFFDDVVWLKQEATVNIIDVDDTREIFKS